MISTCTPVTTHAKGGGIKMTEQNYSVITLIIMNARGQLIIANAVPCHSSY